jgi:hypothetical protein
MNKYKRDQTGAKSQLGGENGGLLRKTYQVGIAEMVKGVAARPTISQARTESIILGKPFMQV